MQNPKYTVRHNFDDPTTEMVFNNKGITGRGTEFPKRIYSQTSFEIQLELFKWDNIDDQNEQAYDLTGFTSASVQIKPAGTTIVATNIGTGVAIGPTTDGKLLFTVDSNLIPDNLATYTSRANPTPISLYLIIEDSVNDNKISLETRIEVMDIDRDGTENNSALNAAGITFNAEQSAKWTARYNDVPVTLENALNKLGRDQPTDQGVVINQLAAQPASPTDGDRYLATATAGDWTANHIHEWNDAALAWLDYTPKEGDEVYDAALPSRLRFESSAWAAISVEDGSITTVKLADDAVTGDKIASNTITQANMTNDSVGTGEIINGSVGTAKLATGAVTGDKLAANAVTNSKMAQMADQTVKGNISGGAADPVDITLAALKAAMSLDLVDNTADASKTVANSVALGGKDLNLAAISNGRVVAYDSGNDELVFIDASGGGGGSSGIEPKWNFSTSTDTSVDPGSGSWRLNNTTPLSATEMSISNVDGDTNVITPILGLLDAGAVIRYMGGTTAVTAVITVTSTPTAEPGFYRIPITVSQAGTTPANLASLSFEFYTTATGGGGGGVISVFGRTGVISALTGDYTDEQITNTSGIPGAYVKDALDWVYNNKANASALGVASTDSDMGTFNGSTISDNVSTKVALQELETYAEGIGGGSGEANTSSNVGGGAELAKPKSGVNLPFRTITSTDGSVTVTQNTDTVDLTGAGEVTATLTGVAVGANDLGTFTGTTISDNNDIKGALQELETAVESGGGGGLSYQDIAEGQDNNQTGTSYTLVLTDADLKTVWMNNASANTVTIPTNASVAFPVGTKINIMREGAGGTIIQADTGVTLNGVVGGSVSILQQYDGATISKRATDTWIVTGGVS